MFGKCLQTGNFYGSWFVCGTDCILSSSAYLYSPCKEHPLCRHCFYDTETSSLLHHVSSSVTKEHPLLLDFYENMMLIWKGKVGGRATMVFSLCVLLDIELFKLLYLSVMIYSDGFIRSTFWMGNNLCNFKQRGDKHTNTIMIFEENLCRWMFSGCLFIFIYFINSNNIFEVTIVRLLVTYCALSYHLQYLCIHFLGQLRNNSMLPT